MSKPISAPIGAIVAAGALGIATPVYDGGVERNDTVSATAQVTTFGTLSTVESSDTLTSEVDSSIPAATGSVAFTEDADTLEAFDAPPLDDEFPGSSLDAKWTLEDTAVSSSPTVTVSGGEALLEIGAGGAGGSFWFNAADGILYWQEVTGDFDCVADCYVENAAGSGLPPATSFRIGGIACHDPDRSNFDYVHVGLGAAGLATLAAESKNTVANVSAYTAVANTTGAAEIRLTRVGQVFTCQYTTTPGSGYTTINTYDRTAAPMPSTCRLGLMLYSNQTVHDMRIAFNYFRVT